MAVRLGQYKAHYWTWSNSWEEFKNVRLSFNTATLSPRFLICTAASSLFVSPNLSQTHKHFHCWCYLENGSSVDCCVHQSVMNINEEPPHQQTCIIHQPVDLFVLTPVEIFFPAIYIPTSPWTCSFGVTELRRKKGKRQMPAVSLGRNYINSVLIKRVGKTRTLEEQDSAVLLSLPCL